MGTSVSPCSLAEDRRALKLSLQFFLNRSLVGAFQTWADNAKYSADIKTKLVAAVARFAQQAIYAAWTRWVEAIAEADETRQMLSKAMFWFQNRAAAAAFQVWVERVAEAKTDEVGRCRLTLSNPLRKRLVLSA
jgi:hypothetical protein